LAITKDSVSLAGAGSNGSLYLWDLKNKISKNYFY
jgi:hypothetical protein